MQTWIALAVLLSGILVGGCGGDAAPTDRSPDRPLPGAGVAVIAHTSPRLTVGLPLLGTAPEGLPADVEAILREPTYGLNWDLAQRIPTRAPGGFWAVPGRDVVCVLSRQSSEAVASNCARAGHAIAHGIAAILISDGRTPSLGEGGRRLLVGIAPAEATTMRVYTDGDLRVVKVSNGAFTLRDESDDPPQNMVPAGLSASH
jgi:hypothetical protein